MNSGFIERSKRQQRVLHELKLADYPPPGEHHSEAIRLKIKKIPQAISTTIGEMRSAENIAAGYIVSFACIWRVASPGEAPGPRPNRHGGTTVVLDQATAPWHDGRPRYYLLAAPMWSPRWIVDADGSVRHVRGRVQHEEARPASIEPPAAPEELRCKNPACGKKIDHGHTCSEACNSAWKESMFAKPEGRLF